MADVHLGARKYGERAFYEDIFQAFEESVEEIVKDRVRALVIAGDLFDSPHPDNATLAFALRKLRELTSRGVKVIAARGEHDTPGRREPSPLDVLAEALEGFYAPQPPPGLKLTSAAECLKAIERMTVIDGKLAFMIYPFFKVSVNERRDIFRVLASCYDRRAEELRSLGLSVVFMGHFSLDPVFTYDAIASLTELPKARYIALGHVHDRCVRCVVPPGRPDLWYAYPGSLYPLDVSEAERDHKRGPLIVDLSGDEPVVQEVNIAVRRHVVLDAEVRDPKDVDRAIRAAVGKVVRAPNEKEPLVHLRLKVGVRVPSSVIELSASRVSGERGLIIIPHITRVSDEKTETKALPERGPESLDPLDVIKAEVGLDELTSKAILDLIVAASEGNEEAIEKALEKLASWPNSLEALRRLAVQ
ncbi:MAG: metallophosphoesterase [Acidilobus sp.]|nr:metallophosphoesterase [Acidilobus sp.]MCG2891662.1 metallophosphoesterase [Acidilobus sp.]